MLICLVTVAIFNVSLISFIYFIFAVVVIQNSKRFGFRGRLSKVLKYYLLPFMIFDIGLVLVFSFPSRDIREFSTGQLSGPIMQAIGISNSWNTTESITFGKPAVVYASPTD
jgi:hypothetical protein